MFKNDGFAGRESMFSISLTFLSFLSEVGQGSGKKKIWLALFLG